MMFILILISCGLVAAVVLFISRRSTSKLPPMAPSNMLTNSQMMATYEGLAHSNHIRKLCRWCFTMGYATEKGSVFRMSLPQICPTIVVSDYKLARIILAGDNKNNIREADKSVRMKALNLIDNVDNIISYSTYNAQRDADRKFIAPAFSTFNLSKSMDILQSNINRCFDTLSLHARSRTTIDMKTLINNVFFETLTKSAFHLDIHNDKDLDAEKYQRDQDIALKGAFQYAFMPWLRYMTWLPEVRRAYQAREDMVSFAEKVLAKSGHHKTQEDKTIIGRILNNAYPTEKHRISDLLVLLVAGHETTAASLAFFLLEMARHPEERRKLQSELDAAIPRNSKAEKHIALSDLSGLEYLNWCLKESMRLWPVAAGGVLRETTEQLSYGGYDIPKSCTAIIDFYSMFHEEWIDRADEFVPERWSESNPQINELKNMLMPFSIGKRACIGQNLAMLQLRILAANLMRHYEFELVEEPEVEFFVTLKPVHLYMKVMER